MPNSHPTLANKAHAAVTTPESPARRRIVVTSPRRNATAVDDDP
jgi:hypothetical protein